MFASTIIAFNAFRIFRPSLLELSDVAPDDSIETNVRQVAPDVEGVLGLHRCRVRKVGFDYFVELDVIVDGDMPIREAHIVAHCVQAAIRGAMSNITKVLVHIEPPHPDRPMPGSRDAP